MRSVARRPFRASVWRPVPRRRLPTPHVFWSRRLSARANGGRPPALRKTALGQVGNPSLPAASSGTGACDLAGRARCRRPRSATRIADQARHGSSSVLAPPACTGASAAIPRHGPTSNYKCRRRRRHEHHRTCRSQLEHHRQDCWSGIPGQRRAPSNPWCRGLPVAKDGSQAKATSAGMAACSGDCRSIRTGFVSGMKCPASGPTLLSTQGHSVDSRNLCP